MSHIDALETRQLFSGGAFDNTFAGGSGAANVQFKLAHGEIVSLNKVVSDSGGRTYVLATTGMQYADATTLQIRRLTAAGTLDGGWAIAKSNNAIFPLDASLQKYKTVPQIDAFVDGQDRLTLLLGNKVYRFTVKGTLDNTFGIRGAATLSRLTAGAAMTADSRGRIYVAGDNFIGHIGDSGQSNYSYTRLYRLTADGQPDLSFAGSGNVGIETHGYPDDSSVGGVMNNAVGIGVLPSGNVVVLMAAGYETVSNGMLSGDFAGTQVARFTPAGKFDASYGTQGIAVHYGSQEFPGDYKFDTADPAGIRTDGSIVIYHHGGDEQTRFGRNELISPDGKTIKRVHFTPNDAHLIARDDVKGLAVQFIAQADGTEFVVDPGVGLFRLLKNGAYDTTFNSGGSPVRDANSAAFEQDKTVVIATVRSDVVVQRIFRDNNPVATLIAKPLTAAAATYGFSIQYRGPVSIDASSLAGNNVRVTASNGRYRYATLASTTTLADHSVIGKYQIADFTGGPWDADNDGQYSVTVLDSAVKDENGYYVQRRTLGNLTVAIA